MEPKNINKKQQKESVYKELNDFYKVIENVLAPLEKKDNFKKQLEKFRDNIAYSLDQVDKNVILEHIELPKDVADEVLARDPQIVKGVERLAEEWSENFKRAHKSLTEDLPRNIKSATMEIDNRRRSVSNWSILAQQLKSENVQRIVRILDLVEESSVKIQAFKKNKADFEKAFEDSNDYLKFLTTLERSIKDLSSEDLTTIEHSIEGIFHNLKIIYMISRYTEYDKFGFLMQVMAAEICQKISEKIILKEIFKTNPEEIDASVNLISQATQVVEKWRTRYVETKGKTKWEFMPKEITGPTEYIEKICERLKKGLIKIKDFLKFLGPELKKVIGGSSARIDTQRQKVFKAYSYIENYPHDIFDRQNEMSCNSVFASFDRDMDELEKDTIQLIHEAFRDLRSAESAFDLYTNFENLINQENIKKAMGEKYINILEQFIREIKVYANIFEQNKDSPPISKAKSEVAGKIAWARLLYLKMKRPIAKIFPGKTNNPTSYQSQAYFNNLSQIEKDFRLEKEKKEKELKDDFVDIAKRLRNYEQNIFDKWKAECEGQYIGYLRNNILTKTNYPDKKGDRFVVKFDIGLKLMIRNTKFLDLYGLSSEIPKTIINIAHQEAQLAKYCNMLNLMLKEYDDLLDSLNEQHFLLLRNDIDKLCQNILIGTTSHNWTSLGIEEFVREKCELEIKKLKEKANIVFKSEEKLKSILKQISNSNFVRDFDFKKTSSKELSQFLNYYEEHRMKVVSEVLNKYEDISTILKEIEKSTFEAEKDDNLTMQTNINSNSTAVIQLNNKNKNRSEALGERAEMTEYYRHWEKCILNSISKGILRAVITIYELFSMPRQEKNNNVLFIIKSKFMSSKDIVYNPDTVDIDRELKKLVQNYQKTGNSFIRWMNGTCKTPKIRDEEMLNYVSNRHSYGTDIDYNREIKFYGNNLLATIKKVSEILNDNKIKYSREFQSEHFDSWGQNFGLKIEKTLEKNKSLRKFETKLNETLEYLEGFKKKYLPQRPCEGNSLINNEELINKGSDQLRKVMNDMLKILAKQIEDEDIKKFMLRIQVNKEYLSKKITDSDSLKTMLDRIGNISNLKLSMELKMRDIEEKLHFLKLHYYSGLKDLLDIWINAKKEWDNLRVKATKKDDKLLTKKKNLAEETQRDADSLKLELAALYKKYKETGPTTDKIKDLNQGTNLLKEYNEKLEVLKNRKENITACQKLFSLDITIFPEINEMFEINNKIEPIYKYYKEFSEFYDEQINKLWTKIEVSHLDKKKEEFNITIRDFNKKLGLSSFFPFKLLEGIRQEFNELVTEIIIPLKDPIIGEKNMKEIMKELRRTTMILVDFNKNTLKDYVNLNLIEEKVKVQSLVYNASKENEIKSLIDGKEVILNNLNFIMKLYKRGNDDKGYIFRDVTEAQEALQENITSLQGYLNDKHASTIKPRIIELEQEMNNIMEIIEIWVEVQKKWMYLESIFSSSEDIRQKLPEQAKEFEEYDKKFRVLMASVYKKPSIRLQCKEKDRKYELKNRILAKFEDAEKVLTNHLDSKKNEFSRFYFLTEQDLLQILGSSDTLATLNPHLIKIYENCKELIYEKRHIVGMKSQEGEILEMKVKIDSPQQVGQWMTKVDEEMKNRLRQLTKEAIQDYTKEEIHKFIKNKLGMVIINTIECWWTYALEDVFRRVKYEGDKYAMKKELERQNKFIIELVDVVRRKDLTMQDRLKVNNLIIRGVHGREIVDKFVRDSILDAREFEWESQLKFYWDRKKDDIIIRQTNGTFYSCYEYQGLQGRLVVTPLTDRCVMTLTTALTFFLGGSPGGPAGTGKTETVKDLGKGLGIRVVVQNCSDTLDYIFMGQFFSGLSQTGFWGCFDEFNRINPEVLSVVTTQIKSIQTALAQDKDSWIFLTKDVKLLPTIGIFITMNPNYEGRSELPDNLKALFRPVTMVTPDQLLICENLLLSEGFHDSRKLACKLDKLYQLCKEQLSKQHHYDWGLRTIKAVLSSAGILKRDHPEMPEDIILMRAMKDINMPKFITDDAILFEGLIKDLFPSLDTTQEGKDEMRNLVTDTIKSLKYDIIDGQVTKVMQMYEVMNIRHTTMICGPPMSGKSCILEILKKTVETMKSSQIVTYTVNPKAQIIPRLYGRKNEISGDFEIGILSNIFLHANQPLLPNKKNELRWVILDGDVDPKWIENMNSVMDDSKQMTLENKDRILMQKYCSLIIESYNINHATLATISRLGMIYVDGSILQGEAVFTRWLEFKQIRDKWDENIRQNLKELYRNIVPKCLKYVLKGSRGKEEEGTPLKMIITQYEPAMVMQLCNLLHSVIPAINPPTETRQLENIFVFCVIWSVGACLLSEERQKLVQFIKQIPEVNPITPLTIYDKFFNMDIDKYEEWDSPLLNIVPEETGIGKKFNEIIIPTMDTKRFSWLLGQFISIRSPCLFIGESGTGKTVTIQNYLRYITKKQFEDKKSYITLPINFSSRTSALDFQLNFEDAVETRMMRTVGPPSGKDLIVFIDDLGMPRIDKYDTQEPIAFLKLMIEKKCFYTKDNKELIKLTPEVNFIGSTLPPGAGNNQIDPRFIALFSVFNITAEQNAVPKIYDVILNNYFSLYPHDSDIVTMKEIFIKATIEMYNRIKECLPRTPKKFHYVFNIRDVSKIFQGFCQLTPAKFQKPESLVKLWRHENIRIYADKLLSVDDKVIVDHLIEEMVHKYFQDFATDALSEPCLYADFIKVNFYDDEISSDKNVLIPAKDRNRLYEAVSDYETLKNFFENALEAYKDFKKHQMDIVFYKDCIDHLLRIHRIIRIEYGNTLLIGTGGSGKQSLAKLASFIARYDMFSIKISSRFEEKHLREQLVDLFRKFSETGDMTPISFLFLDEQVLDEGFMELINNILTTGIVPAIFEKPEKEAIIEQWKNDFGIETKDVAFNKYVEKIRQNLHMIICMSPSGDKLRDRCRNFPGLISNTTIDWFFEWPKEALTSVCSFLFDKYTNIENEEKPNIINHMVDVHLSIDEYKQDALKSLKRYIYTTPKNFLDFIKSFKNMFSKHSTNITTQVIRLEKGLEVLAESGSNIEKIKIQVEEEGKKVAEFLQVVENLKNELSEKSKACKESTELATEKKSILKGRTLEIEKEKEIIENNVVDIKKLIEQVKKTVSQIKQQDVDQNAKVTRFEGDSGAILKAVYFCLKETAGKWDAVIDSEISILLSKSNLFSKMIDIENTYSKIISPSQSDVASKMIKDIKVKTTNQVLMLLQNWIINFDKFYKKNSERIQQESTLKVKLAEKEEAEKGLAETMHMLNILTEEQVKLETAKAEKDREYKETSEKLKRLQDILSAATELFEGLKSEQIRWSIDMKLFLAKKEKLIGDCLLGSAFLSYCGPFTFETRHNMIYQRWKTDIESKNINVTKLFNVQDLLASEQNISQWNLEGLPDDELSIQNGILTLNATRWPLCVDPEMQAISWIKKRHISSFLCITFNTPDYMKKIIRSIESGGIILIENVTEFIDPNLNPILEKNYHEKAGLKKLIIDSEIDVHEDFRLYMTTKLSNPHYSPEIMAKTVVINYSVTMEGLEEQLLNEVVRYECPSLEETRKKLVDEMNTNKITLKNCEDALLNALNDSAGTNIVENKDLIETLKRTKGKAREVSVSLEISKTTKKDIYEQRDNYKPVAKRGSILYFSMTAMRLISSMYEYSLGAFMKVYKNALSQAQGDIIINTRLDNIKRKLTQLVYEYTCLSIFEKHKLMFSFHMRTMIMKFEETLNESELIFFLRGNLLDPRSPNPIKWLSDLSWQDLDGLVQLSTIPTSLIQDITKDDDDWKMWYGLEKPEDSPLPQDYDNKLTMLQKLLLIRVFRKDRIYNAIKNFIKVTTNTDFYVNPPVINMEKIFNQSNEKTPILFILSPGVDPMSYVTQLAAKKGFLEKKFRYMSLGQKQEKEATDIIQDGVKRGLWILLQNCDLLKNWLKDLENIIDNLDRPKPDFRLWLTTSPIQDFPIGILQKSFKVVTEPPDGLPQNINRVFNSINEEAFDSESSHFAYKPLVYTLSFFHSVLQDRKKFGKIGWNVNYDFNESDFTISKRLLTMYLNKIGQDDPIPWSSLKYLIGEAMYGGRVTDDFDRRVMMTYLNEYMGDFIFDQNQKFNFSTTGYNYNIPENGMHDYYIKCISEMPNIYSPEVIGLHSNAEIDYFTQASKVIWTNLLVLKESSSNIKSTADKSEKVVSKEQFVADLSSNILTKLPEKFDIISVNRKFPTKSPIDSVLLQEIDRFNNLNSKIRKTLSDLIKALNGEISMNSETEEIMNKLNNGMIPQQWLKLAPETQKSLGSWIDHLRLRYEQYENWLNTGEPKVMWLSGLHVPASYLKAIIQTTSRKRGWALDKVDTYTVVTKYFSPEEITEKLEYGCYIHGVFLEGAEWNTENNNLERQHPKKLLCEMPLIQIIPAEASKIKLRNNLKTPVYMTQNRKDIQGNGLVFEADLRTVEHPNTWILQGVALVLNTYY